VTQWSSPVRHRRDIHPGHTVKEWRDYPHFIQSSCPRWLAVTTAVRRSRPCRQTPTGTHYPQVRYRPASPMTPISSMTSNSSSSSIGLQYITLCETHLANKVPLPFLPYSMATPTTTMTWQVTWGPGCQPQEDNPCLDPAPEDNPWMDWIPTPVKVRHSSSSSQRALHRHLQRPGPSADACV
jgi:hypothetical protein